MIYALSFVNQCFCYQAIQSDDLLSVTQIFFIIYIVKVKMLFYFTLKKQTQQSLEEGIVYSTLGNESFYQTNLLFYKT
jgi:hypothetical protein